MARRLGDFLTELRRRKVYQVAAVYGGVGLATSLAVPDLFGAFELPSAAARLVIILIVIGFPVALVLAWAYELAPERPEEKGITHTDPEPVAIPEDGGSSPSPGRRDAPAQEAEKSIVVLPFDNMSPDPQDQYLGDGLTEELTARLSKLGSLRVISRTSAMALKGTNRSVSDVARELAVHYALEGSVRKAGSALRITAQLIDASRDRHLWAETYSGTVDDVFGMQESVAHAIVESLRVELTPRESRQLEERPFQSFQAYQYYIQARADALMASESALDRGLETATRGLASVGDSELLLVARGTVLFQYVNSMLKPPSRYEEFLEDADGCADRALALNPHSAPARTLKGFVAWARGNMPAAVTHATEALVLDPNNPEALLQAGFWRAAGGWDPEGARHYLTKLEELDPLTPLSAGALGWLLWFQGDYDGALKRMKPWWEAMDEGNPWMVCRAFLQGGAGDFGGAARTVDGMRAQAPDHLLTGLGTFLIHAWRGEREQALAMVTPELETAARWDDAWPMFLAGGYASVDEIDRGLYWLDHAIGQGIMNVPYLMELDPFIENLRRDPRFHRIVEKATRAAAEAKSAAEAVGSRF